MNGILRPSRRCLRDREVVGILLRKLLELEQQNGALLDGFPRTKVQMEGAANLNRRCATSGPIGESRT